MKKRNLIRLLAVTVVMFTVLIVALVLIGRATNGTFTDFKNASLYKVNSKNLYQKTEFEKDATYPEYITGATPNDDVAVGFDKNKVLTVNGTLDENESVELEIGTVTLAAGKYIFDSSFGANGSNKALMELKDDDTMVAASKSAPVTFTVAEEATYTIRLYLAGENTWNNLQLKPIICVGSDVAEDIVPFYVNK